MKRILSYCFEKSWRIPLFFGITVLIYIVCNCIDNFLLMNYSFILLVVGFIGLLFLAIYQMVKRRWIKVLWTIILFVVSFLAFIFYLIASFWNSQSRPDGFADNLKIPNNIEINEPLEFSMDTVPTHIVDKDFFIYNGFQPGLYSYTFWTKRIDKGEIYLKAFEVTEKVQLSANRLKTRSIMSVSNSTDSLKMFQINKNENSSHFTIYEGDWGKPYAARFELWFIPDDGGKERKLAEKIYKVEGWQR